MLHKKQVFSQATGVIPDYVSVTDAGHHDSVASFPPTLTPSIEPHCYASMLGCSRLMGVRKRGFPRNLGMGLNAFGALQKQPHCPAVIQDTMANIPHPQLPLQTYLCL